MNALDPKLTTARKVFRAKLLVGVLGGILLAAAIPPLVYFSHSVPFRIEPPLAADNARVSVSDGAGLALFDTAYVFGKRATLRVEARGFISREVAVDFTAEVKPLRIELQEAPVRVVITTEPALAQTQWRVDGVHAATAERFDQAMQPGAARIEIDHEFYRPETLLIDVPTATATGGGDFTRHLKLTPVAGALRIHSQPTGARLLLNGEEKGVTPFQREAVPGGAYRLQVILQGHAPVEEAIVITNRLTDIRRDYRLTVRQSTVRIDASPPGGVLRVNGVAVAAAATAPLSLAAGETHRLQYEKPGYVSQSGEVSLKADEQAALTFQLEQEMGEVVIRATPPADLRINGAPAGTTPQSLRLQALPQKIILARAGYRSVTLTVTPSAAAPLLIDQSLQTELAARLSEAAPVLTAAGGVAMKLFDPRAQPNHRFTMGAPSGEKFRRANEFQRKVALTKAFYISATEITEEQFARYKPVKAAGKKHPVRNVSWPEAAGFANWMSAQDGLRPAYQIVDGQVRGFDATADGYRLPSEAEWEWLARVAGRANPARFVWGDATTIPKNSGNFADESAKGGAAKYIPRYDDGFAGVAPVASFAADAAGLYDMAGNVSEWVHDRYDLQPPEGEVETNPFGGRHGDGRVVKGASFRTATATGLRSSFREGLSRGRDDVGFRVARYLYGRE